MIRVVLGVAALMTLCESLVQAAEVEFDRASAAAAFIKVEGVGEDGKATRWTGSGVVVHPQGWVVTNRHVAPGNSRTANTIRVVFHAGTSNEQSVAAKVVLVHADRDLALLKCDRGLPLPAAEIADRCELKLTDDVTTVGFPLGARVVEDGANPSISVVTGKVSSLRRHSDGRLWWLDFAAPVAGGNSGSSLLDKRGLLNGIVTRRYEGFGRASPVEFVHELMGEAFLQVKLTKQKRKLHVHVKPKHASIRPILGYVHRHSDARSRVLLAPKGDGVLEGSIKGAVSDTELFVVTATLPGGMKIRRHVALQKKTAKTALRCTIHSVMLSRLKPNGFRWDGDDPDPFCKIYVNGLVRQKTEAVRNQRHFLKATTFDCREGDRIRVVVYDEDFAKHDWAGEIRFTATAGKEVRRATAGKIDRCDITVRPLPVRPESR